MDTHPSREPVLVLGSTGGQGGAVAAALLDAGIPVRALVRDPGSERARKLAAAGAELTAGDFTDSVALTVAMRDTGAAFALTTPFEAGPDAELVQGKAIIAAARAAHLPFLVFSSVAGATAHTGVPHFESKAVVERQLAASGIPHTIVAPTYFYDNALGGYREILGGVLELPLPAGHRLQQLDRRDLGRFVALMLGSGPDAFAGRRIEIASDAPTPAQMSSALSSALGRAVEFTETPMPLVRARSADMAAMWDFLRGHGYQADIEGLHRDYPSVGWTSFAEWAQRTFA
jgi:uncharacterized protein YbjT (DUF2867 family)